VWGTLCLFVDSRKNTDIKHWIGSNWPEGDTRVKGSFALVYFHQYAVPGQGSSCLPRPTPARHGPIPTRDHTRRRRVNMQLSGVMCSAGFVSFVQTFRFQLHRGHCCCVHRALRIMGKKGSRPRQIQVEPEPRRNMSYRSAKIKPTTRQQNNAKELWERDRPRSSWMHHRRLSPSIPLVSPSKKTPNE